VWPLFAQLALLPPLLLLLSLPLLPLPLCFVLIAALSAQVMTFGQRLAIDLQQPSLLTEMCIWHMYVCNTHV